MAVVTVDFDGTLYQGNSFKAMFDMAKKEFSWKEWAVLFVGLLKATLVGLMKGKEAFKHQFFIAFAKNFQGKTREEMDDFFNQLVHLGKKDINWELVQEIKEHQQKGNTVIVLSGALHPFLLAFTKEVGLDVEVISTKLQYDHEGNCTGQIGPIINGKKKVEAVQKWMEQARNKSIVTDPEQIEIWAYADSESDIPLFKIADFPIVVNPNKAMKDIAKKNDWPVFA